MPPSPAGMPTGVVSAWTGRRGAYNQSTRGPRRAPRGPGGFSRMWTFAWRNLLTRPLRTALALVGLSIPILGVLGLYSVSGGLRNLVGDTLSKIQGVVVLREDALS